MSEVWAAPAARGEWPPSLHTEWTALDTAREEDVIAGAVAARQAMLDAVLEECLPTSRMRDIYAKIFADSAYSHAEEKYVRQITEAEREKGAKKAAENQAALKREEPAVWAALHECAFGGAARLALASDEPAETIVAATFAACRPQRTALIELHKRYGDLSLTDELMDKVEARVAGALVLEVIRARAAKSAPAAPITPTPAPSKPEQSI